MSKLHQTYLLKKDEDSFKYYLFKCGAFYIFLDDDAKAISEISTLKLTNLNSKVVKCGFPVIAIDRYLRIFNNLGLSIEIIDDTLDNKVMILSDEKYKKIAKILEKIDLNNTTPIESMKILSNIKGIIDDEL